MADSISRRRIITMGTAAMAGTALPLVPGTAQAEPRVPTNDPSRVFDVRRFGAKGDGVAIDTDAVNRAIDEAAKVRRGRPGTVYFPAGTYACFSIHLKSNVALYFAQGATLLAATPADGKGYDPPEPGVGNQYQDFAHSHWHNSLIWGENLTDVTIFGPGVIDGNGLVGGRGEEEPGAGNKAIALKLCRNVTIRDITILNGGTLAILPTGVDNLRVANVMIDTYSDGLNLDSCRNVRVSNAIINTPNADSICLKSSYALDEARACENVIIDDCRVSGYDLGTLYDGTFQLSGPSQRIGRIKFGTESNGGFKNIAISNVIFEHCRGFALLTVDGGLLQDVTISNIIMRHVEMPIFLRLGSRMSAPPDTKIGKLRRVSINDLTAYNANPYFPSTISGIPDHAIEDIRLSNIRHRFAGGLTPGDVDQNPPENEDGYPETDMFGPLPAYGYFIRHAEGITFNNVDVGFQEPDTRPAYILRDVADASFHHNRADKVEGAPTFVLDNVDDFTVTASDPVPDTHLDHVDHEEL